MYRGGTLTDLIQPVFTELIWVLGSALIAWLVAIAAIVRLNQKPERAVLLGAAPAVIALATTLGGFAGLANADLYTGTIAACLLRPVGVLALLPLCGTLFLAVSALGWSQGGLSTRRALGPLFLGVAVVALTFIEGQVGGNVVLGSVRAATYAGLLVVAAPALASARTGLALGTGLGFAVVVAGMEGASRALVSFLALTTSVRMLEPGQRLEGIETMARSVASEVPWGMAAVALALCVPLWPAVVSVVRGESRRVDLLHSIVVLIALGFYGLGLPDLQTLAEAAQQAP